MSSEPFVGELSIFGGNFAPRGWALCDGQLLPISQYSALFSILGTIYGGDGVSTFGLPDLRSRVAIHPGNGPGLSSYRLGQKGGAETVTLTTSQIPAHNHSAQLKVATSANPVTRDFPDVSQAGASADVTFDQAVETSNSGGGQPHDNIQPFQCVNYIIALQGIYPSRS